MSSPPAQNIEPNNAATANTQPVDMDHDATNEPHPFKTILEESGPFRYSVKHGFPVGNVLPFCSPDVDASTITAMFQYAARIHGPRHCLAYRTIVGRSDQTVRHTEVKNTEDREWHAEESEPQLVVKTMLSDWNWWTFDEVNIAIRRMAAGLQSTLRSLGPTSDQVAGWGPLYMFADTSPQWFMMCHAAALAGIPIVGVNIRLGESQFIYTVNESAPTALFTDARSLPKLLMPLVECLSVKLIIYYLNSSAAEDLARCELDVEAINIGLMGTVVVRSFDEMLEKGLVHLRANEEVIVKDPERAFSITYPQMHRQRRPPKPVVFQEKQVVATVAALVLQMDGQWKNDDRYLTHLPLYSMLEFAFVHAVLLAGHPVGFATQETKFLLSSPFDNGVLHPDFKGDFNSFNPTFAFGIMPWWSAIENIIHNRILAEKTEREREQFWLWYHRKKLFIRNNIGLSAAIQFVEKKAGIDVIRKALLGDKIRWIANYCSRMPKEKREFLGLVLGGEKGKMVEGFMIQELNTVVTFMSPRYHDALNGLGRPIPSLEIKLLHPRGQIRQTSNSALGVVCIRGPSVPLTEDSAADGWVITSFYGKWNFEGRYLQITKTFRDLRDRYLGDYVPLFDVERILTRASFVEAGVLVYGGRKLELIGVLSVNEEKLREFVNKVYKEEHYEDLSIDEIMLLGDLKARVVKHLRKLAQEHGCTGFELLEKVVMIGDSFTKSNGLIHKNGDLDRKRIMETYREEILYEAI